MSAPSGSVVTLRVELHPKFVMVIDPGGYILAQLHKDVVRAWDNETLGAVVRSLVESLSFDWRRQ